MKSAPRFASTPTDMFLDFTSLTTRALRPVRAPIALAPGAAQKASDREKLTSAADQKASPVTQIASGMDKIADSLRIIMNGAAKMPIDYGLL